MKYRIHMKKPNVIVKGKMAYNERINEREMDFLVKNSIPGLFHISYDGKKQLTYEAPCTISMDKYLKNGMLTETIFWRIVSQMLDVEIALKHRGLYPAHLLVKPDTVFINEETLELYFIYQPVISANSMTDNLFAVIHDMIYLELKLAGDTKPGYLIDFQNYLQQSDYSLEHVRQYIDRPSAWNGNSGFSGAADNAGALGQEEDLEQYTVLLGSGGAAGMPSKLRQKQVYITRIKGREQVVLSGQVSYLGRNSQCDYCISGNSSIGRKHAAIQRKGDDCYLTDLGSVNGTSVNGRRMAAKESCKLQNGDRFRLADEEFVFEFKE